jgi:lysophospholipase L1-like esterase
MKRSSVLLILTISTLFSFQTMQTKKKILFFGDSITQAGVSPEGYISRMDSILKSKGQDRNYELLGAGIGGNKVYDLYLRMEEDVLSKKPDAVVIWIGVNDVWHKRTSGTGTDADKFEKFYSAIIKKLKDQKITVYLCTPAAIGEKHDATNSLDGDLNLYSVLIRKIAAANECGLVDLRQAFLDHLKANNGENKDRGILTTDGVHLNRTGNIFVAQRMYEALYPNFIK